MDSIDKAIEILKGRGADDVRQIVDLEYNGTVGDDEPVADEDGGFPDDDMEDNRLPSERFYHPDDRIPLDSDEEE